MTLPVGTVTFLLTDIEGSTRLWEQSPETMRAALARHDILASGIITAHSGVLVKSRGEGDSLFCVFARATDAVAAAVDLQRAFSSERWARNVVLRVRIAIDTGEVDLRDGDYYGPVVNRCARLRSIAHGGQVLLSEATRGLVRDRLPMGAGLADLGTHRLRDVGRAERLFHLVHPDLPYPADFPPLRSQEPLPNNLPRHLTTFVGRQKEVAEVERLLQSASLITLTGSGGCGKTRLALQTAQAIREYPDGVWFADLAPLPAGVAAVVQEVARALGVAEESGRPLDRTLADVLYSKSLLLLLDNCEHVLPEVAPLTQALLHACPHLRVLATSRECLGIDGETTFRVPSLAVPDPRRDGEASEPLPLDQLLQYDAVHLFAERAAAASPGFSVTEKNAAAVIEICTRLDGIPLAIELAAARVRTFSVELIATRLSDRFRLLSEGGARTALLRHQTLRALIDWSFELLSEEEQNVLAHLSVFAGGFTLEAADAVGSGNVGADISDVLARLVEKSMVNFDAVEGAARYRLLEIIRQYAAERLEAAGKTDEVCILHRDYFLRWAESEPEPEIDAFEAEHDNLRIALDSFRNDPAGGEGGLRLAKAMWGFWQVRGHLREGRERYTTVLEHPGAQEPTRARASALNSAGNLAQHMGDYAAAHPLYDAALSIYRALESDPGVATVLNNIANTLTGEGELNRAAALFREALAIERKLGRLSGMSITLYNLAEIAITRRQWKRARRLLDESRRLHEQLGGGVRLRYVLWGMGRVAVGEGGDVAAHKYFSESIVLCRDFGDRANTAALLLEMAQLTLRQGNGERAARLWGASESLRTVLGTRDNVNERRTVGETIRAAVGRVNFEEYSTAGGSLAWESAVDEGLRW